MANKLSDFNVTLSLPALTNNGPVWLASVAEVKEYVDGAYTDKVVGYRVAVVLPALDFTKLEVVVEEKPIITPTPRQNEYIFVRDGERLITRQIAYVMEKYSERQGKPTKSTHKMRKTYASMLAANGVPLDAIREVLGHTELSNTLAYIYNSLTEKDTYELISKAFVYKAFRIN